MLGWGNGCLWCQITQHSLRLSLWQCGHVSVISHASYSSACYFTALLPWLQDGRELLWWQWTGSWTENMEFGEQISCLANAKDEQGQQSVDIGHSKWHTLPCLKLRSMSHSYWKMYALKWAGLLTSQPHRDALLCVCVTVIPSLFFLKQLMTSTFWN